MSTAHSDSHPASLTEIWGIFLRRLWITLLIAGLVTAAGVFYTMQQERPHVYRSGIQLSATYALPDWENLDSRLSRDMVVTQLRAYVIPQLREVARNAGRWSGDVSVLDTQGQQLIVLESRAVQGKEEDIAKFHADVVAALQLLPTQQQYRALLEIEMAALQGQLDALQQRHEQLQAQEIALTEARGEGWDDRLIALERLQFDVRNALRDVRVQQHRGQARAEALRQASSGGSAIFLARDAGPTSGAGPALIVVVSLMLGIIIGLFCAFLWEFVVVTSGASQRTESA